jgi:hypothetical protein
MYKHLFDRAIGEAPPSTVDADAIVARERRAVRLRGMASPWVATAAAVVALTFAVTVAILPPDNEGSVAPAVPPASTASSSPTKEPSSCERMRPTAPPTSEVPASAASRLTDLLTTAVQTRLPAGATLAANPSAEYPEGTKHGPLEFFHVFSELTERPDGSCTGGDDYFLARADVNGTVLTGNILAAVGRSGPPITANQCTDVQSPERTYCDQRTGPNGEVVVVQTLSLEGGPTSHQVRVSKLDGTVVDLHAQNVSEDAKKGGPPESPAPPLTLDQLIEIALDPGMTLYP